MINNRKRNRLQGYDYSKDNLYFITSCVQDRICCFGEIRNKIMILNTYGEIANDQWHWMQKQYPYVVLHEFVVMPNHIHGIIEINRSIVGTGRDLSLQLNPDLSLQSNPDLSLQSNPDLSLQLNETIKIKSLSELIGAYKTTTSKKIHIAGNIKFGWQRSFHDHIIRDEKSYENISKYIQNNPSSWNDDKFFNQ